MAQAAETVERGTALADKQAGAVPEIVTPAKEMMGIISTAVSSPNFDPEKFDRLLDIQERWLDREAREAFARAFAKMQPELPEVERAATAKVQHRDNKGSHSYKYARFGDILAAIKPVLHKHGFGLSHRVNTEKGITVQAVLWHEGGHSESTTISLGADKSGSKNDAQAVGSSIEYARRYSTNALLGIATKDADTDANPSSNDKHISPEQLKTLKSEMEKAGVSETDFCKKAQIDNVECLEKQRFQGAMRSLKKQQENKQ